MFQLPHCDAFILQLETSKKIWTNIADDFLRARRAAVHERLGQEARMFVDTVVAPVTLLPRVQCVPISFANYDIQCRTSMYASLTSFDKIHSNQNGFFPIFSPFFLVAAPGSAIRAVATTSAGCSRPNILFTTERSAPTSCGADSMRWSSFRARAIFFRSSNPSRSMSSSDGSLSAVQIAK
jgi:hypothetical protein